MNRKEDFIKKARIIHGDKYDYSKVEYINSKTKVEIICKTHGSFFQAPAAHLQGKGCKFCGYKKASNSRAIGTEKFINKSKLIHGDKYDYSKVEYGKNVEEKVEIICKEHGSFFQTPHEHLKGSGCYKCRNEKIGNSLRSNINDFINKSKLIHGNEYDYSKAKYNGNKEEIILICKKHGEFKIRPDMHLSDKRKCPHCSKIGISKPEYEIIEFIKENVKTNIISNNRKILNGLEIDIYLPDYNLAIEYNGLYWHSEQNGKDKYYHLDKTKEAWKKNIRLIHIFEDEWRDKKEIIKNRILYFLGIFKNKIGARNCIIKKINSKDKNLFLNETHIQGEDRAFCKYGAFYNDELVGVMTFCKPRVAMGMINKNNNIYELSRFSVKNGLKIHGLASKFFTTFIKEYSPDKVYTYSDIRWNKLENTVYEKIKMKYVYTTKPNYFYLINKKRKHRFSFRKSMLKNKLNEFDENLTEYENMLNNGYDRIWDCGHLKFEWEANCV